jgi:hypothetical protein
LSPLLFGCNPIPDVIVQEFGGQPLQLPTAFEDWRLAQPTTIAPATVEFVSQAYSSDRLTPFIYGEDGITGFAVEYKTEFVAQRRHNTAVSSLRGTFPVDNRESETLAAYDGFYFYESEAPRLMFHISNHTRYLAAPSTGISRTSSLRRALAFAERIFEVNELLGTRPLRPFQLTPLRFLPSNAEPILPAQTRFELDLSYIVADRVDAFVAAEVWWFKAGRGPIVYSDSFRVRRGTGEVSFTWDIDLSEGIISDILNIRAHINYPSSNGNGVIVPSTSFIQ